MTARELFLSALLAAPEQTADRIIGDQIAGAGRGDTLVFITQLMTLHPKTSREWIVANALWRVIGGRA